MFITNEKHHKTCVVMKNQSNDLSLIRSVKVHTKKEGKEQK